MSHTPFHSSGKFQDKYYELFMSRLGLLHHNLEKASERCRLMLYIITLGSILISIVNFNANISWDRKINAKDRLLLSEELSTISPLLLKEYNDQLVKDLDYKNLDSFNSNSTIIINDICRKLEENPKQS